jgi:Tryptophan halogenase
MAHKIDKIVIVGGGSAGWMTAATLIKFFPEKTIEVLESPHTPTVGVGESTLGAIRDWTHALGIDEKEFMRKTDATYKLAIEFTDFYEEGSGSFYYPFGNPVTRMNAYGLTDWQIKKALNPELPVTDYAESYFPQMALINHNKFNDNFSKTFEDFNVKKDVAYHFDAMKFGVWLRDNYCLPRGVKHTISHVLDIKTNDDGIEKIINQDGSETTADLFIDCTGFRSLLLGGFMQEPFDSFSDILPNDRAWAMRLPYIDKEKEMRPVTKCHALKHGWVWTIPLWSRLGVGYVYSSKFVDDQTARQEFEDYLNSEHMTVPKSDRVNNNDEYNSLVMRVGIHKRTWVKNVVAIGLSAGFIEPLESNGLFSVHEFLEKLVHALQRPKITQFDKDAYNYATRAIFDGFAEFVSLHYALSVRDDSDYWKWATEHSRFTADRADSPTKNKGFQDLINRKMFDFGYSGNSGLHCIAVGMNYMAVDKFVVSDAELHTGKTGEETIVISNQFWEDKKHEWNKAALESPTLYEYLKEKIYNEETFGVL